MPDVGEDPLEWFGVVDESLAMSEPQPEHEPELSEAPAKLLARARDLIPAWRSLGIADDETYAGYLQGSLWVGIELTDHDAGVSIGFVRLQITDEQWTGAWVSSSLVTEPELEEAGTTERTSGRIHSLESSVETALTWLQAQLARPITRYVWRDAGDVRAESWRLDDTGRELVVSGPAEARTDPSTATEAHRVR